MVRILIIIKSLLSTVNREVEIDKNLITFCEVCGKVNKQYICNINAVFIKKSLTLLFLCQNKVTLSEHIEY